MSFDEEIPGSVPLRRLTDPLAMRALAHPIRASLLELLMREGSLTATRASELTGESPANCSFHLRQLAKYGFAEETGEGKGRERPWRPVSTSHEFDVDGSEAAATHLRSFFVRRNLERLWAWFETQGSHDPAWRDAALVSNWILYLTEDEFRSVGREITRLLSRYLDRTADPAKRPEGSRPVGALAYTFPLPPTPAGN
ncbi:MAG TPA: helix-turn-helix domain-containing protein [Actinomycetota bacterium]|nr:helix-turn-helix domain-containing protein [Actinomycetota bacterium]